MNEENREYLIRTLEEIANNKEPSIHSRTDLILEESSKRVLAGVLADKLKKGYSLDNPLGWERKLLNELL